MNVLDLFAGCGGLALGFKKQDFNTVGFLEWEKSCVDTLKRNFCDNANRDSVIHADIRDFERYVDGREYSLKNLIDRAGGIDGVIGGPPCQAYSLAGRIRDPQGMRDDYRNYLFEAYCQILSFAKPKFFVFENVLGMLSAKPNGVEIASEVQKAFDNNGYECGEINRKFVYNFSDYGGPQHRKRIIIFGVRKDLKGASDIVTRFHSFMNSNVTEPGTVDSAIGDLRPIYPIKGPGNSSRVSHNNDSNDWMHHSRFHNKRDIEIFRLLAEDIKSQDPQFKTTEDIKRLYTEMTGKKSSVHKYYVLRQNEPSNLIPAHLHKDGLRHIHPDPEQARSITPREAARLQSFPDSFEFVGSRSDVYKMIGNAVPPDFASQIALAVKFAFK